VVPEKTVTPFGSFRIQIMTRLLLTLFALLAGALAALGISIHNRHDRDLADERLVVERVAEEVGRYRAALDRSNAAHARQKLRADTRAPKTSRTKDGDPRPIIEDNSPPTRTSPGSLP
jgi:hypothetical protein